MDIFKLLDLCEQLLQLYGYDTERDVGIKGKGITTADIVRETERGAPKQHEEGIIYRADILAEKKDIERPFGRVVVHYKREPNPVTISDVTNLSNTVKAAGAYMGILLTVTGYQPQAKEHALNLNVRIIGAEDIETMLGKAAMEKPWWRSVNALPIYFTYPEMVDKIRHTWEHYFFLHWEVTNFQWQELAYIPYWKFLYQVKYKAMDGTNGFKSDLLGLNAHTGMLDSWHDVNPGTYPMVYDARKGKAEYKLAETGFINLQAFIHHHKVHYVKLEKPRDLPPAARFEVYRPAIEKYEAKIAGQQWVAYLYDTDPQNVTITGLELIYVPWWRFRVNHRPFYKNPWKRLEWFTLTVSPIDTDVYNLWKDVEEHRRDIVHFMAEKYLINLLGAKKYIKVMNWITYKLICRILFWDLHIRPDYRWIDALFVVMFVGMVYGMIAFQSGLMLLLFLGFLLLFIGPGYAFLYILREYLARYPSGKDREKPKYTQWEIFKTLAAKKSGEKTSGEIKDMTEKKLYEMYSKGELTEQQKKRLQEYWRKKSEKEFKEAEKYKADDFYREGG